jgi:Family of unknown function (DUF5990)
MEREIVFRIVLEKPPAGFDFGLQKGRGNAYRTVQKQRSAARDLCFEFSARAISDGKSATPNLVGPFVQGPHGARFVYIDIGAYAGQAHTTIGRRLKIPLSGITAETLRQGTHPAPIILETRVPGTRRDGGPNCATVKPFAGWKLASSAPA